MTRVALRCYDGGRHRWMLRQDFLPSYRHKTQWWCQRCGKWRADLNRVPRVAVER